MSAAIPAEQAREIARLKHDEDLTNRQIADRFSISPATVHNVCQRLGAMSCPTCTAPMQHRANRCGFCEEEATLGLPVVPLAA